jgi:hypothetical protein
MPFKSRVNWKAEISNIKYHGSMGITMAGLARKYGVSRQRMKQVVDKLIPNWSDNYGFAVNRKIKAEEFGRKWDPKTKTELYRKQREKFRLKKYHAKRIGWEWSIEFQDIVWNTHCPILGVELDYFSESIKENSPSFDQIDAGKGYVAGNVHIISWRANRIKNNGTSEEHRKIADYLDSLVPSCSVDK